MNKVATALLAVSLFACGLETEPNPNCAAHNTLADVPRCIQCEKDSDCDEGMSCVNQACVEADAAVGGMGGSGGGGDGGITGGTSGSGSGGMTGGSGGDGSVGTCERDEQCGASLPECDGDGECAPCTGPSACADRDGLSHCESRSGFAHRGACVECTDDSHCTEGDAQKCIDSACVECENNQDCPANKPECGSDGTCGACTGEAACSQRTATPHCVAAGPQRGECAECTSHGHCDNSEPQCDATTHSCEPCTTSTACEGRSGTVCDTSSDATFGGTCVKCTGANYGTCADGATSYVCDSLSRVCSTTAIEGTALVCQPCVADAQCAEGMACMQTRFGAADTGNYCLWKQQASNPGAPDGNCGNVRPYIGTEDEWSSVDGDDSVVCKPARTTCQAQSEFLNKSCSGPTPAGHAECGAASVADAYCAPFLTGHRCTVPCVSYDDCQDTRPGDDMECQAQMLGEEAPKICLFE